MPRPSLDFWFDLASNYSYLSVMRIAALAERNGVDVCWRPFLLGPILDALGWEGPPFVVQKEKGAYVWQDMRRQCRKYALPWQQPSEFPRRTVLATRLAVLAADEPWLPDWCRAVMTRNYGDDREVDSPEAVAHLLTGLGLPAQRLIEEAGSETNRLHLRERTQAARDLGIFGAPTFFVGAEMFWGNDRLEDAMETALRAPRNRDTA
ncbi:2-hydroxychromene-2-carboxylate isomerase [Paraburkholderia sp. CNPSo 3272]|uniref:2-hydroxychromene-2-carboxylate isomerase n=1 Tax=Paraburkholderia sp. CNPSo 3272 TaxID=2940931 RepID=UPI0020B83199|nr:2-hydroxychromene-2-carboxylate isomerase [Paraburkholderia sp. CNPSo 3272]MCP3723010.1 2-hydroxychromene-2-carboxylate isomerase [Paraburkholderia sp. CNPSo 3272]